MCQFSICFADLCIVSKIGRERIIPINVVNQPEPWMITIVKRGSMWCVYLKWLSPEMVCFLYPTWGTCRMVPPSDVCWFINPMNTIVLSAINHSEIGVFCTN